MVPKKHRLMEAPKGPLTLEEISAGMEAAFANAASLLEEALLLQTHGYCARALSSVLTAEQELGKIEVLRSMAKIHPSRSDHWQQKW